MVPEEECLPLSHHTNLLHSQLTILVTVLSPGRVLPILHKSSLRSYLGTINAWSILTLLFSVQKSV